MPDPSRPPEWMVRDLMERYGRWVRGELQQDPAEPQVATEAESLAELGFDGSRLRRRYWKKVTER